VYETKISLLPPSQSRNKEQKQADTHHNDEVWRVHGSQSSISNHGYLPLAADVSRFTQSLHTQPVASTFKVFGSTFVTSIDPALTKLQRTHFFFISLSFFVGIHQVYPN
jgi:hypothetical protein